MAHLGLEVNRLIRISYGPFQLGELRRRPGRGGQDPGAARTARREDRRTRGRGFQPADAGRCRRQADDDDAPRGKKPFKPAGKSGLIADRKGRRVLVQRTGSDEARARNEAEASGYGPPRRPQRGYHGKRDLKPRDE